MKVRSLRKEVRRMLRDISNEELRKQKDSGFREQKLGFNGDIDMSKMRPTEFPSN